MLTLYGLIKQLKAALIIYYLSPRSQNFIKSMDNNADVQKQTPAVNSRELTRKLSTVVTVVIDVGIIITEGGGGGVTGG